MKVFIYRPTSESVDCAALVLNEEGEILGSHVSSSLVWAQRDIARHVPQGAEAVWCVGREALQIQIDSGALRGVSFEEPT